MQTADGALFAGKVENVCPARQRGLPMRLVVDADAPSELGEEALLGPRFS